MPSENVTHCPAAIYVTMQEQLFSVYVMECCLSLCIWHSKTLNSAQGSWVVGSLATYY